MASLLWPYVFIQGSFVPLEFADRIAHLSMRKVYAMRYGNTIEKIEAYRRRKMVPDSLIPNNEFGDLYRRVTKEYGATCLWNCHPTPTPEGAQLVAERLMGYGDLRAWHMAHRLLEIANDAFCGMQVEFQPVFLPISDVNSIVTGGRVLHRPAPPLHTVDIAITKVLAAASRREVRDYVDLALIHTHSLPLWHAIWAAPGKDAGFNPASLINSISKTNHFSQSELDKEVASLAGLDASSVARIVREALDEASQIIHLFPPDLAGYLFVDLYGNPVTEVEAVLEGLQDNSVRAVAAVENGAWPSSPDIDRAIIERIIGRYGLDGEKADQRPGF